MTDPFTSGKNVLQKLFFVVSQSFQDLEPSSKQLIFP